MRKLFDDLMFWLISMSAGWLFPEEYESGKCISLITPETEHSRQRKRRSKLTITVSRKTNDMASTIRYKLNIQYRNGITEVLECKSKQEVELWQSLFDTTVKNWLLIDTISNKIIDRHSPPIKHFY